MREVDDEIGDNARDRHATCGAPHVPSRDIDGASDSRLSEGRADAIPLGRAADEEVIDVAGLVFRKVAGGAETELRIARSGLAPKPDPSIELAKEDAQDRRVDLVEARVVAEQLEVDLVPRAMKVEQPNPLRELGIVRCDQAAVADAEEVLRRIEAE